MRPPEWYPSGAPHGPHAAHGVPFFSLANFMNLGSTFVYGALVFVLHGHFKAAAAAEGEPEFVVDLEAMKKDAGAAPPPGGAGATFAMAVPPPGDGGEGKPGDSHL